MQDNDTQAFLSLLDTLAEILPATLSTTQKMAYYHALKDVPLLDLAQACDRAVREEERFPVPAVLRRLAGHTVATLPPADAAWIALRNLDTRYNRDALSDPITREVFEAMGGGYVLEWGFGNWPLEQEDRKRREFIARYHEICNRRALANIHWREA